jgi:hypothetical protein
MTTRGTLSTRQLREAGRVRQLADFSDRGRIVV